MGWELGVHLEGVEEAAKEYSIRVGALEQENRQLQGRLTRGHEQYEQLRESMNELLNLHQLSETISTSFRIEDILDSLMDLSNRFVPYETCGVFVLEEEGNKLDVVASRGTDVPVLRARVQSHWEDGIIDWVMRERRPVVIDDIDALSRESSQPRCFVMIPLIVGGKEVGIFILHCAREKDDFTLGQVQLLDVLSNQTAAAVSNSRHYSDLESTHDQLVESQQQVLISAKQAAIGELAGGVAHEVNNPLQIILSRVQLMNRPERGRRTGHQGVEIDREQRATDFQDHPGVAWIRRPQQGRRRVVPIRSKSSHSAGHRPRQAPARRPVHRG